MYSHYIKRPLDFLLALCAIIALSPVLLVVAVLVKIKLGSPIIFSQSRPGYRGKIFKIYKFKSMKNPQTRDGRVLTDDERQSCLENGIEMLSDEERLTKFGRFIRACSIDELPELFNILKGEMSFVGPRPLEAVYLPYYTEQEMHRHDVLPGLTGLAQINGRNACSWEKRFEYDLEYVRSISFIFDIKIILKTILVVLKQDDIAQGEECLESLNVIRKTYK